MKLFVLTMRRPQSFKNPVLVESLRLLRQRSWQVDMGVSEEMILQPGRLALEHDLYVLKSHTELTLSLASLLCTQGARVFHPYPNSIATQNKILAEQRLRAARVPVPRSWVTAEFRLLEPLLGRFSLIIKPHQGYLGRGINVVHNHKQLSRLPAPDRPVLIQEYIPGSGEDLKAYVVGDEVWAVHKVYSTESFARQGRPCRVTRQVRDIALRCGKALGLGIYGVDMVESESGPVVVDVNFFPGFRGVRDVAPAIASYLDEFARGGHDLALPDLPTPSSEELASHLRRRHMGAWSTRGRRPRRSSPPTRLERGAG